MNCLTCLDGHERRGAVAQVVSDEFLAAEKWYCVGKVLLEEVEQRLRRVQSAKLRERHEQRHGPRPVLVRQGDHHERASRPDVQVVLWHGKLQYTSISYYYSRYK